MKTDLQNPFPGLRPFRSDEDYLFFGREQQIAEVLTLLRKHRFLTIVGTSGSGKSSLVRAGILPELLGGGMSGAGSRWAAVTMHPGGDPLTNLARGLIEAGIYDEGEDTLPQLLAALTRSKRGLLEVVQHSGLEEKTQLVLLVDQFEEIFRLAGDGLRPQDTAHAFVRLLLEASEQREHPIYVVLTMHSDYLGDCALFRGLAETVNAGEYLIPRFHREQLQAAIEGPINVGGGNIAYRLVQELLGDLGEDQDQLPVLQHALMRTWDEWAKNQDSGEPMDLQHYESIGTMREALSRHADEIYLALPSDAARGSAQKLFQALTEKGADNRGVRRPLLLKDLSEIVGAEKETRLVIDAFRAAGRTFLMPEESRPLEPGTVIDISHESLMRVWRRLDVWVEEESQSARIYRRLHETAALHAKGKAGLYHDPDLQIAQSWRGESQPNEAWVEQYGGQFEETMAFLDKCEDAERQTERDAEAARQREVEQARNLADTQRTAARNFKRFAMGMGVVALVALAAFAFAFALSKQEEAADAEEKMRMESASSAFNLGKLLAEQDQFQESTAYFARSLERVPDNPAAIDRLFNILAYEAPPGYASPPIERAPPLSVSAATPDGRLVVTRFSGQGIKVWEPFSSKPVYQWNPPPGSQIDEGLSFSPDGGFLAIGAIPTGNHLLDTRDWKKPVWEFAQKTGAIWLQFSVDGRRLFTVDLEWTEIWDISSESRAAERIKTMGYPSLSPDESKLITSGDGGAFVLTEVKSEKELQNYESRTDGETLAAFTPDGKHVLIPHLAKNITDAPGFRVLTVEGEPVGKLMLHDPIPADAESFPNQPVGLPTCAAAVSRNGERILSVGSDLTIRLWNTYTGDELDNQSIPEDTSWFSPRFSADGKRVMLPTRSGQCYYWHFDPSELREFGAPRPLPEGYAFLADSGELRPLLLPKSDVVTAVWDAANEMALLGTNADIAAVYNTATGEPMGEPMWHGGEVAAVALSSDGTLAATGSDLGTVRLWDARTGQSISGPWVVSSGQVRKLVFTPDNEELVVFADGEVSSWDVKDGRRRKRLYQENASQPSGDLSRDGQVVGIRSGVYFRQIDRISGEELSSFPCGRVNAMAFSPDERIVAIALAANAVELRVVGSDTLATTNPLQHDVSVLSLGFSPDGKFLVTGDEVGKVRFWHSHSGQQVDGWTIEGDGPCTRVALTQDGERLVATFGKSSSSYARVWDIKSGLPVTEKLSHGSEISNAVFNADGSRVMLSPGQTPGDSKAGIASVRDISIVTSNSSEDLAWLPEVATAYGGLRLNAESQLVSLDRAEETTQLPSLTRATRAETFFRWLAEFPGTRPDSPFRPEPSEAYVEQLKQQTDIRLLNEAVRLRPRDAVALAKRAALRAQSLKGAPSPGQRTLAIADLIKAQLLEPQNPRVQWLRGMSLEKLGDAEEASAAFQQARELGPLTDAQLDSVLATQEVMQTGYEVRKELLTVAIEAGADEDCLLQWHVKRFELGAANDDFEMAQQDWQFIVEQEDLSFPWKDLLDEYLNAATVNAEQLHSKGQIDAAITLLKPVALIKDVADPPQSSVSLYEAQTPELLLRTLLQRESPADELISKGAKWTYLDDGTDQGTAWRELGFADQSWKPGRAPLGYGGLSSRLTDIDIETDIEFGDNDKKKHTTYYFRHRLHLGDGELKSFLKVDVMRDDGVIVFLNGEELLLDNMPAGEVSSTTFATRYTNNEYETRFFPFVVESPKLRSGENLVAVEVHQDRPSSTDLGFDLKLSLADQSPAAHITSLLEGANGGALLQAALEMIPKPLRDQWNRDFTFIVGDESSLALSEVPEDLWLRKFEFWGAPLDGESALKIVEARLALLSSKFSPTDVTRTIDWLRRKEAILKTLVRPQEEISAAMRAVFSIPAAPRDPALSPKLIDLSDYYNATLYDGRGWHAWYLRAHQQSRFDRANNLASLPGSFDPRHGVAFDLRGIVQIDYVTPQEGHQFPDNITGIRVGQKAPAIHFLTSCFGSKSEEFRMAGEIARPSEVVANFVMHYSDGSSEERPIIFGQDVLDWGAGPVLPEEVVGWRGTNEYGGDLALSELIWTNPHPDKTIETIDFVSSKGKASPFLVAITLE